MHGIAYKSKKVATRFFNVLAAWIKNLAPVASHLVFCKCSIRQNQLRRRDLGRMEATQSYV